MPIAEDIGGVSVSITGDYTDLQAALTDSQALAEKACAETASAFTEAASGADSLTASVTGLTSVLEETGTAVGSTAASVGGTSGAFTEAGGAAEYYAESAKRIADGMGEIPPAAEAATVASGDLVKTLLEIAGVAVSIGAIKAMLADMVEDFAKVERAQEAFSMIRGSAEAGAIAIERLKEMAQELALPFDALVPIAQRMSAMGLTAQQVETALRAAADASRYSGVVFETVSAGMLRMGEAGMVSGRFLIQLGINMTDLASVMGVKSDEVQKSFRALTETSRFEFLEEALAKTRGAAEKTAGDTAGSMTRMANDWKFGLEEMGKSLSVFVVALEGFSAKLTNIFADIIVHWDMIPAHASAVGAILKGVFDRNAAEIATGIAQWKSAEDELGQRLATMAQLEKPRPSTTGPDSASAHEAALRDLATESVKKHAEAVSKYTFGIEYLAEAQKKANANFAEAQTTYDAVNRSFMTGSALIPGYVAGVNDLAEAQKNLEKAAKAAGENNTPERTTHPFLPSTAPRPETLSLDIVPPEVSAGINTANEAMKGLQATMGGLFEKVQVFSPEVIALEGAFKRLGLTAGESGAEESKSIAAFQTIATNATTSLGEVNAAWTQVSGTISRLGKTDIPQAIVAWQEYIGALERTKAPLGQIQAAQEQMIKLEVQLAAQNNQATTIFVAGLQGAERAFDGLGAKVAGAIVSARTVGQVWHDVWTTSATDILTTVIHALEQMILKTTVLQAIMAAGAATSKAELGAGVVASKAASEAKVSASAGESGAAGFASVMESIPFPANVALAPAIAAAAAAATLAFGQFALGGMVPSDMLALIHAGEYVTPAAQVAAGNYGPGNSGGGGGMNVTVHMHGATSDFVDDVMNQMVKAGRRAGVNF